MAYYHLNVEPSPATKVMYVGFVSLDSSLAATSYMETSPTCMHSRRILHKLGLGNAKRKVRGANGIKRAGASGRKMHVSQMPAASHAMECTCSEA